LRCTRLEYCFPLPSNNHYAARKITSGLQRQLRNQPIERESDLQLIYRVTDFHTGFSECQTPKGAKGGAGGGSRTLTGLLSPADFLTVYGFRRPKPLNTNFRIRFAVWTIPSPSLVDLRLRCCPSSLYTFPADFWPGLARDCHTMEVSPTLSSSAPPVSQRALKSFSQVRCVCHSATPAWRPDCLSIIGQDCSEDTFV
jgi:hypothetical protein